MHVLVPVLHRPTKPTGVCRHATNLARCLSDSSQVDSITLVIGDWQQDYFTSSFDLSSPKITVHAVSIKNSAIARNQWYLTGLPKLAKSIKPDVVHLSFPFPFVRSWLSAPTVSTIHDLYPYECPENFGYPRVLFNRWFLKQCVQNSDGLCCVSKQTLASLKQYFLTATAQKAASVIYNYVEFGNQTAKKPTAEGLEATSSYLFCVAQHRKNKNLDLLIRAYAQLKSAGKVDATMKLVIVGSSGPETDALREIVRSLSISDSVLMLSGLEENELCWLYEHCEAFVTPSSMEGFCIPLAEALYLGCRVVCTDIPIFREVGSEQCVYFNLEAHASLNEGTNTEKTKQSSLIIEDESVDNLAGAIASALSHPKCNKSNQDRRFSRDEIMPQYLDLYYTVEPSLKAAR